MTGFSKQLDVEDMPPLIYGDTTAAAFQRAFTLASNASPSGVASTSRSDDDSFRLVLNHMIDKVVDRQGNSDDPRDGAIACYLCKAWSRLVSSLGVQCSSSFSSSYYRLWRLGARTSPWEFYSGACFQLGAVICQFLPSIAIHTILGEIKTGNDDDDGNDNTPSSSSSSSNPSPSAVAALVLLGAAPLLLGVCDTQRMARGKRVGIRVQCLLNVCKHYHLIAF